MNTHLVVSGSYIASLRRQEILQAFLGSCVGITLCDREAGVGGLIHLLLPEPPSMDISWRPEVSAATGLPIFLEALAGLGAKKHRMTACIAGGALIDPLSSTDLILDIGGRTAEIALQVLDKESIPVEQSEIGGYFSCRLKLNLCTWETIIEPIAIPAPCTTVQEFNQPDLRQLDDVIERLLPVPQVALKIIRMIGNDSFGFRDIAREVLQDQVLSARILKLCNSVSLNTTMRVSSIEKALMRIGEKSLLPLALSISMEQYIVNTNSGYSLCKGGLFNHSIWTANISGRLAQISGKVDPDLAYTAGLLHDIGKVVLDQYMYRAYPLFYRRLQAEDDGDLSSLEKELFGISHTDSGYRLARQWDFPEPIAQAILHHHCPEKAEDHRDLVHLVYVADYMSYRFMPGHVLAKMDAAPLQASLESINFDPARLSCLIAEAHFSDGAEGQVLRSSNGKCS